MNRWMFCVPHALVLVLLAGGSLNAQQAGAGQEQQTVRAGIITGRVIEAGTRRPLNSAQVYVPGAQVGTLTNEDGRYTITGVPAGPRLVRVESIGYGTTERAVTVVAESEVEIDFEVRQQVIAMDQVVATALGIQRGERSLGYAVQTVDRRTLERSPELLFVDAIAGRTAGTHVSRSTGQPGGSSRLVIRGEASFRGDGQPLYILDGVPIINEMDRNGHDPLMRGEAGSRLMDVDPANIEEVTVLRGAAATALYGSRAALGAVIIRTRQGTPGAPFRLSYSSRFGYEDAILGGLQTSWAQGRDGYYCNGRPAGNGGWCQSGYPDPDPDPVAYESWGPHRDSIPSDVIQNAGRLSFRDPRTDFLKRGAVSSHSLYGTGSLAGGTYGIGFGYAKHEGVMTNSQLDRLNLNANINLNLLDKLASQTTLMHANTINDLGWEGALGFAADVSLTPPTRDLSNAWNADGTPVMFGDDAPHPQWLAENEWAASRTSRWIVSQLFAMDIGHGLTLSNRIGLDTYLDERREHQNERPWLTAAGQVSGGTRQQKITRRTINNDLVLTMNSRRLGDGTFGANGLVGINLYTSAVSDISGLGENMSIPGFYTLSNFTNRYMTNTLPVKRRLAGAYAQWTFDYQDWAFFTLTGRNDWSSTLPEDRRSVFYPSASLAVLFTEALSRSSSALDFGKVRLSLARVGADAPPYRLRSSYVIANYRDWSSGEGTAVDLGFPFRGVKGYFEATDRGNSRIRPESTVEAELGLELNWLRGLARTDISLYRRRSYDQIFSVPAAPASGFRSVTENAGDLTNRGVELSLGLTPLRGGSTSWELRANVSRNWSRVDELAADVDAIYLAGPGAPHNSYRVALSDPAAPQIRIMAGHPYGVIWGTGYSRNERGELLIGDDGWPLVEDGVVLGSISPEWLANLGTTFSYRALTLSALLDMRRGGRIVNADLLYTIPAGTAKITERRNDRFVWEGVNASTGQRNTTELLRDRAFWERYATVNENLVESGNVTRLREASIAIRLPDAISRRLEAGSMSAFITARNLFVDTPFSYGDPDGNNYGALNAGGGAYRFFTVPTTRSWMAGVRATF